LKNSDHKIIDFSSNITPLGIPNSVKSIIKKNLNNVQFYPDPNSENVISSLEKYTHLSKSNIIVGNGAIEILYNFCYAFLSKTTKVLIHTPTFQEYETSVNLSNCKISYFKSLNLSKILIHLFYKFQKMDVFFSVILITLLENYYQKKNYCQ